MKTDNLHIRIDPERKKEFRKRADDMGMSIAEYFEHLMDEEPMTKLSVKQDVQRVKYELSMIGTNLNQIAHALNGEFYHFSEDAEKVEKALEELKVVLGKVLETF